MRRLRRAPVLIILVVWAACATLVAVAFAEPQRFWTLDADSIAASVEREGEGIYVLPCTRREPRTWRCDVEIDPQSGPAWQFVLTLDEDGCWRGTRHSYFAKRATPLGGRQAMSGCVQTLDHLWP